MELYATDKIYIVDAHLLTIAICIVDEVKINHHRPAFSYIDVTNEKGRHETISLDRDFNINLDRIRGYYHGDTMSGVFSFTDEDIAKEALKILVKKELFEAEIQLDEYKKFFFETFDRVSRLQTQYNSLTKDKKL
jgi:hypothetical protein